MQSIKDVLTQEKVFIENLQTIKTILSGLPQTEEVRAITEEAKDIMMLYRNIVQLYAETFSKFSDLLKAIADGTEKAEELKVEMNSKIDELHNDLQQQITDLRYRVEVLESEVDSLKERMAEAEEDIDALEERCSIIEEDIANIETYLQSLKPIKIWAATSEDIDITETASFTMTTELTYADMVDGTTTNVILVNGQWLLWPHEKSGDVFYFEYLFADPAGNHKITVELSENESEETEFYNETAAWQSIQMPSGGSVGDYLAKTADGATWETMGKKPIFIFGVSEEFEEKITDSSALGTFTITDLELEKTAQEMIELWENGYYPLVVLNESHVFTPFWWDDAEYIKGITWRYTRSLDTNGNRFFYWAAQITSDYVIPLMSYRTTLKIVTTQLMRFPSEYSAGQSLKVNDVGAIYWG